MMVEERIVCQEREDGNMCALSSPEEESVQEIGRGEIDLEYHVIKSLGLHQDKNHFEQHVDNLKKRWTDLCSEEDHSKLQQAIMHQVAKNHRKSAVP